MDTTSTGDVPRNLNGIPITLADLPDPETKRWVASRKAIVVHAVRGGLISLEDVLERYKMTAKEFRIWEQGLKEAGTQGLKVTKFQEREYRDRDEEE